MLLGEAARLEEGRRKAGDRGEILPLVPCKEVDDVRLLNLGGCSLLPSEPELGALGKGGLRGWSWPGMTPGTSDAGAMGEEEGKVIAATADSERRSRASDTDSWAFLVE